MLTYDNNFAKECCLPNGIEAEALAGPTGGCLVATHRTQDVTQIRRDRDPIPDNLETFLLKFLLPLILVN